MVNTAAPSLSVAGRVERRRAWTTFCTKGGPALAIPSHARTLRAHDVCGLNLVDPASSYMLVSKIKPCMFKYKLIYCETANGSLKQLSLLYWLFDTWIPLVILVLIHAPRLNFAG